MGRGVRERRLVALEVAAPKPALHLSVAWRAAGAGPATRWFVEHLQGMPLVSSA